LWRRLEAEHLVVRPAQDRLIASLEELAPRKGFRRLPIAATLRPVAARWRALPAETRLALKLTQHGEKLSLAEVRIVPSKMRMEGWDDTELVLGLVLIQIGGRWCLDRRTSAVWRRPAPRRADVRGHRPLDILIQFGLESFVI
jgi:hypothetical protein